MTLPLGRRGPKRTAAAGQTGTQPRGGRLAALDGLRLIAALIVSLYHFTGYTRGVEDAWGVQPETAFPILHNIGQYGWLGVELFFMISGFVICMSSWGRSPGAFFQSRVIRLFPAYWGAVLITSLVITIWPVVRNPKHWHDVVLNLTMLQEPIDAPSVDAVYWTLWNEALFYLLFTVVIWRGLTLRRAVIFGYSWLIASMLSVESGIPLLRTLLQAEFAPFFVAGITLYLIYRFGPDMLLWGLLAVSFGLAQYWTARRVVRVGQRTLDETLSTFVGGALVTAFFVILLVIALGYTSRIQWRWLTTAGALTYPFYLLHENIGWTIIYGVRDFAPRPVILVSVIAIMLVAAYLLHRVIEKPLARLLKKKMEEARGMLDRGDRWGPAPQPAAPAEPLPAATPVSPAPAARAPEPDRGAPVTVPAQRKPADNIAQSDTLILPMYRPKD